MGSAAPPAISAKAKAASAASPFAARFRPVLGSGVAAMPRAVASMANSVAPAAAASSSGPCLPPPPLANPHRFAPAIDYKIRGQLDLTPLSEAERQRLSDELLAGVITRGTAVGRESNMRTWALLHHRWFGHSVPLLPLTAPKIFSIAAQMKAAGYRTFPNFLVAAKDAHLASFPWTDDLERCRRQCVASTQRGIGPPRQCMVIPIDRLAALQLGSDPAAPGGPICPSLWGTLCGFHLVRGAEAACALASSVVLDLDAKTETWFLPASKTDPTAVGCRRTWGCVCGLSATTGVYMGAPPCPFHAALELVCELKLRFGSERGCLPASLPLFPGVDGAWCARAGFVASIARFADLLDLPRHDSLGRCQVGEHVWRVTGARMLASLDLPQPVIMLLARWGSEAIIKYVADAPLSRLTEAYLSRVQAASNAALGGLPDAPAASAAAPLLGGEATCLADASALALLEPQPCGASLKFAVNRDTSFVHLISDRQAWERPRPGRTSCGWDYVAHSAPLFVALPAAYRRCGKCCSPAYWEQLSSCDLASDSD